MLEGKNRMEGFFSEIRGVEYYNFAFLIARLIFTNFQAEVFCDAQNAPNLFFTGALSRTSLGSSRCSPRFLGWGKG